MTELVDVSVPDIGDFQNVEIIELLVKVGDSIELEQPLITLESDKASIEVPSTHAGVIEVLHVQVGDKVSKGSALLKLKQISQKSNEKVTTDSKQESQTVAIKEQHQVKPAPAVMEGLATKPALADITLETKKQIKNPERAEDTQNATTNHPFLFPDVLNSKIPNASPSIRKFARELEVDLKKVEGSGPNQRILREDLTAYVKQQLGSVKESRDNSDSKANDLDLIPWPSIDFAKFGPVESQSISRIKKIASANLHRNWVMIPHVTNHDDADITHLEEFRIQMNAELKNVKITLLPFLIKICVAALKKFPEFNSSLEGNNLILKKYYHIGFAADTPHGLVVPVIRDADQKSITDIAQETADLASKAREGKLSPSTMQGGTFSVSSLGGIGGTYFTPIINAPEVAILGFCRSSTRAVWNGSEFTPRLILPLSLSWDHRVVDGASAARFNRFIVQLLEDFRRISI